MSSDDSGDEDIIVILINNVVDSTNCVVTLDFESE